MGRSLEEFTREELLEYIKTLKKQKKFGLVWEDKPENVVKECETKLPVVREVEEKTIENAPGEPTNIIIEGDNYHALSVLNYTHAGKVDVIYIDPPYNTGNKDFVYNDCYVDKEDTFRHSKWLSFMSKRLELAKNLLADDGVIFISIDDNEQADLKLLCDYIFGDINLISVMPRKTTEHMRVNASYEMQNLNDYVLLYAKNKGKTVLTRKDLGEKEFPYQDSRGPYMLKAFQNSGANGTRSARPNLYYPIYYNLVTKKFSLERNSSADIELLPKKVKKEDGRWLWSREKFLKDNELLEYKDGTIYRKSYFDEDGDNNKYEAYKTWLDSFPNRLGANALKKLGLEGLFEYSKPPELINYLVNLSCKKSAKILDFFAGSGTTGQAVMELNKEDGGHRQFILVTNNEAGGKADAGEEGIAEKVTYPRIKTVITGIRPDGIRYSDGIPANLRYFKTDFVEKGKTTDDTREALITECSDMIRIRENAFEFVANAPEYRFYKNDKVFVPIIFDQFAIAETWEKVEELNTDKLPVHCYNFSYNRHANEEEIPEDTKLEWTACSIPETVLEVYRKIFRKKEA